MAHTNTSSIIKTRSQSRTIAPAPAPVVTGRTTGTNKRTIDLVNPVVTTTDPAPVDDLFAGCPTTGTLKDPPPVAVPVSTGKHVPRDRDSDSDDDTKKPAAKPKGRRPKATRKPRKPRTDPADDLVDPMSRVHVGDACGRL